MMTSKSVMLVDDDALFLRAMGFRCRELGLDVQMKESGAAALEVIRATPPDLLILDINMPGMDGFAVRDALFCSREGRKLPTIFLTGRSDPAVVDLCQHLQADHVLKGPTAWTQLKFLIDRRLDLSAAPRSTAAEGGAKTVMIVDDDRALVTALQIRLARQGHRCIVAYSGYDAFPLAMKEQPDLVISDINMPGGSGEYLLVRMKDAATLSHVPIVMMTGARIEGRWNSALEREMLGRRGAAAFISKPLDTRLFLETVDSLLQEGKAPHGAALPRH